MGSTSRVLYSDDYLLTVANRIVMATDNNPRIWILALNGGDVVSTVFTQLGCEVLDFDLVAQILEPELNEVSSVGVSDGVDFAVSKIGQSFDCLLYTSPSPRDS